MALEDSEPSYWAPWWYLRSGWLVAGGLVLIAFSAGLAQWHENKEFLLRHGEAGTRYLESVRWGSPSALPYVPERPKLNYGGGCDVCESVGAWVRDRKPVRLDLLPARAPRS